MDVALPQEEIGRAVKFHLSGVLRLEEHAV